MHIPVLLNATVDALAVKPGGVYIDGTLGRAGHAREILARAGAGSTLVGIDRDEQALEESAEVLKAFPEARIETVHGRHGDMAEIAREKGIGEVDGILLDLGVSSPQLDEPERGFSFQGDGPLDMRMDRSRGLTAADILATGDEASLAEMFRTLGEEPQARRVARAIVRARAERTIATTAQLAELVERTIDRHGAHHPATRVFQALRMAVNDELGELERALDGALPLLRSGGRIAVISFESITDRVVKRFFTDHAGKTVSLQGWDLVVHMPQGTGRFTAGNLINPIGFSTAYSSYRSGDWYTFAGKPDYGKKRVFQSFTVPKARNIYFKCKTRSWNKSGYAQYVSGGVDALYNLLNWFQTGTSSTTTAHIQTIGIKTVSGLAAGSTHELQFTNHNGWTYM